MSRKIPVYIDGDKQAAQDVLLLKSGPGISLSTDGIEITISADPLYPYPINSIYISSVNTNPSEIFGGTWEDLGTTDLGMGYLELYVFLRTA